MTDYASTSEQVAPADPYSVQVFSCAPHDGDSTLDRFMSVASFSSLTGPSILFNVYVYVENSPVGQTHHQLFSRLWCKWILNFFFGAEFKVSVNTERSCVYPAWPVLAGEVVRSLAMHELLRCYMRVQYVLRYLRHSSYICRWSSICNPWYTRMSSYMHGHVCWYTEL